MYVFNMFFISICELGTITGCFNMFQKKEDQHPIFVSRATQGHLSEDIGRLYNSSMHFFGTLELLYSLPMYYVWKLFRLWDT